MEDVKEQSKKEKKEKRIPKLSWLLLKNTIALLIPAVIIFGVVLTVTIKYPFLYRNTCHTVDSLEEIQEWYERHCYNVQYTVSQLKYTGYDYYENEKQIGAYYYTFVDDQCLFVLIKTKNPEVVIETKNVRGKILHDSAHLEAMIDAFVTDTGLEKESFFSIVYPIMLSEVDYPFLETLLVWLLIIVPYIVSIVTIFLSIMWMVRPYMHPSTKVFSDFGDRQLVYQEINSQMKWENVIHRYHYYFTKEYLIISNWFSTDFVRIDFIRYISKHVVKTGNGKRQIYRLTMSNPEKMFYEKDFKVEACADEIMEELIQRNPHIDNRTIHVFDLPLAEEETAADMQTVTQMQTEDTVEVQTEDIAEVRMQSDMAEPAEDSSIAAEYTDSEDMKIYKVKHRLRNQESETEDVKIYKVKHRIRKKKS